MGKQRRKSGFIFEELENGEILIADYEPKEATEILIFPTEIEGKKVTQICLNTFVDAGRYVDETPKAAAKKAVKKVVIPEGVNTITPFNNYCYCNVETIVVSSELGFESIRRLNLPCVRSFEVTSENKNYSASEGVLFSADKTELICYPIGKREKEYRIPDGTVSIGNSAFSELYHRELINKDIVHRTVIVPQSVESIGDEAFWSMNVSVMFVDNNHLSKLGKSVFLRGVITEESNPVFPNLMIYKGNGFSEDALNLIKLPPLCEIEFSSDIDYREYLLFSIKGIIAGNSKIDETLFSYSFSDLWYESKYSNHHFTITIDANNAEQIVSEIGIKELELKDGVLQYTFPCNPQKMHYGQRTYKKYIDNFKKILEKI